MIGELSPASCVVDCAGSRHHLVWRAGALETFDHPDPERERALTALGGDRYRCLELLEVWQRHRDDLDVLVLGSRGPRDPLVTRRREPSPGRRTGFGKHGWVSYSGGYRSMSAMHRHSHEPRPLELRDVLRLGGGVPDRLSAEVIATWSARVVGGDVAGEVPRLHAALYGRFAATVRGWLGDPDLQVQLVMGGPGSAATVERNDDTVRASLPFSWLDDVWVPGLSVVADRLVLSARTVGPGRYELDTLDRGLTRRATVSLEQR